MDKKKEKFEVGDKVRVIDSEECYPYHYPMFKLMGFKDTIFNDPAPQGTVGTIFYMVQESQELFMGINYGEGKQTLIGSEGVELVKEGSRLEEPIYRVGDTVYHYNFGKGSVTEIRESKDSKYPVEVYFPEEVDPLISKTQSFSKRGSLSRPDFPVLSFTEYNLVDGGFSQERPLPYIELPNIHPKWKYFSKRGPIMSLWVDKPSKMWFTYSSDVERRHVGNILKIEIEDGIFKIKR